LAVVALLDLGVELVDGAQPQHALREKAVRAVAQRLEGARREPLRQGAPRRGRPAGPAGAPGRIGVGVIASSPRGSIQSTKLAPRSASASDRRSTNRLLP